MWVKWGFTSSWAARAERGWGFDSLRSDPDPQCRPERTWPPSFPAPRRSYSSPAGTHKQRLGFSTDMWMLEIPKIFDVLLFTAGHRTQIRWILSQICVMCHYNMHSMCRNDKRLAGREVAKKRNNFLNENIFHKQSLAAVNEYRSISRIHSGIRRANIIAKFAHNMNGNLSFLEKATWIWCTVSNLMKMFSYPW